MLPLRASVWWVRAAFQKATGPHTCCECSTLHIVGAGDRSGVGYGSRHVDKMGPLFLLLLVVFII